MSRFFEIFVMKVWRLIPVCVCVCVRMISLPSKLFEVFNKTNKAENWRVFIIVNVLFVGEQTGEIN